jgi:Ca2+-binding RTX toxin-like protein
MAKAVHKNNNINDIFNGDADLRISKDRHTAVYEDDLTAGKLVFKGSNLTRETGTEYFSGGTIRQLLITDENNDFAFRLTGLKISASDLPHNYTTGNLTGLLSTLMAGADKVVGGRYDDYLYGYGGRDRISGGVGNDDITGGAGNDTLRGGSGSDVFHFFPATEGKSRDVIKDFDVWGSRNDVDYLHVDGHYTHRGANGGRDTLIVIDNGSTILLEDVRPSDIESYWRMLNDS